MGLKETLDQAKIGQTAQAKTIADANRSEGRVEGAQALDRKQKQEAMYQAKVEAQQAQEARMAHELVQQGRREEAMANRYAMQDNIGMNQEMTPELAAIAEASTTQVPEMSDIETMGTGPSRASQVVEQIEAMKRSGSPREEIQAFTEQVKKFEEPGVLSEIDSFYQNLNTKDQQINGVNGGIQPNVIAPDMKQPSPANMAAAQVMNDVFNKQEQPQ